jgi:cell division protein FtsI/penicillin-binding protein 2
VILGEDYQRIYGLADPDANPDLIYAVLADYVPAEKVLQLQQFAEEMESTFGEDQPVRDLSGIIYTPHLQRSYPENELASNILGFVSREGKGYFGVEEKYNDLLAGVSRTVWMPSAPNQIEALPDIPPGASLILTIDREIQDMVEKVLDDSVDFWGAESGTISVMDPNTGEILAMATTGRINLNEYWKFTEQIGGQTPFNQGIGKDYEPGSVFKVLTMAAALDSGVVQPETEFLDTGLIEVGGAQIRNWNWGAWGPQSMTGCMQHSLNVCLAWLATQLGTQQFYDYMQAFGLGHSTGVDLSGELVGRLKLPGDSNWYAADLGTNSFGQGLSVTPVQMLMAVSALANEGEMVVPHVLLGIVNNGRQYNPPPQVAGYPIKPETARILTEMLANSLEQEASVALVEGYRMAGKTGTGEIPTPYGYTSDLTNTSFVGWGPVDNPQFVVYIWLEKPSSSIWGSEVAAPIFSEIVQRLVVLLNIPPDGVVNGQ